MSRITPNLPNPHDVGPMTSNDLRCPQCSAHVSPDAHWCTLCFADLRPAPVVEEVPDQPAAEPEQSAPQRVDQVGDQVLEQGEPGRGKHARSKPTYDDAVPRSESVPRDAAATAEFEARAEEMLALLAADTSHPLGPVADRLKTNSARAVAAGFGFVLLLLAVLLVMALLGHFI
jgi:hypothetical protein